MSKRQPPKKPSNTPRRLAMYALLGGVILLILAGGLAIYTTSRPPAAPTLDISQIPDYHDEQGIPYPDIPRITVQEARAKFDAGTAIFVDVRSRDEYQARHIPGAISMPIEEIPARYNELPKDAEILLYCT